MADVLDYDMYNGMCASVHSNMWMSMFPCISLVTALMGAVTSRNLHNSLMPSLTVASVFSASVMLLMNSIRMGLGDIVSVNSWGTYGMAPMVHVGLAVISSTASIVHSILLGIGHGDMYARTVATIMLTASGAILGSTPKNEGRVRMYTIATFCFILGSLLLFICVFWQHITNVKMSTSKRRHSIYAKLIPRLAFFLGGVGSICGGIIILLMNDCDTLHGDAESNVGVLLFVFIMSYPLYVSCIILHLCECIFKGISPTIDASNEFTSLIFIKLRAPHTKSKHGKHHRNKAHYKNAQNAQNAPPLKPVHNEKYTNPKHVIKDKVIGKVLLTQPSLIDENNQQHGDQPVDDRSMSIYKNNIHSLSGSIVTNSNMDKTDCIDATNNAIQSNISPNKDNVTTVKIHSTYLKEPRTSWETSNNHLKIPINHSVSGNISSPHQLITNGMSLNEANHNSNVETFVNDGTSQTPKSIQNQTRASLHKPEFESYGSQRETVNIIPNIPFQNQHDNYESENDDSNNSDAISSSASENSTYSCSSSSHINASGIQSSISKGLLYIIHTPPTNNNNSMRCHYRILGHY